MFLKPIEITPTLIISCKIKSNGCLDILYYRVPEEISDLTKPKKAFSATNLKFDFEREIWMIAHPLYVAKTTSAIQCIDRFQIFGRKLEIEYVEIGNNS